MGSPSLHHYSPLGGNYSYPQGLQRPSPAAIATMYAASTAGLPYHPSDWGFGSGASGHGGSGGGGGSFYGSRDHPHHHDYLPSCAVTSSVSGGCTPAPLSLTTTPAHPGDKAPLGSGQLPYSQTYPGVGGLAYTATGTLFSMLGDKLTSSNKTGEDSGGEEGSKAGECNQHTFTRCCFNVGPVVRCWTVVGPLYIFWPFLAK